jgi:hypothetical protein
MKGNVREFIEAVKPVITMGLIGLKIAAICAGLPVPIPGLSELLNNEWVSFIDNIISNLNIDTSQYQSYLDNPDISQFADKMDDLSSLLSQENSLQAYARIEALMRELDPDKKNLVDIMDHVSFKISQCFLNIYYVFIFQRVIDGKSYWIKNDPDVIKSFEENKGRRMLNMKLS